MPRPLFIGAPASTIHFCEGFGELCAIADAETASTSRYMTIFFYLQALTATHGT